ncbi:SET domain-containing protein, partial [Haematococcus lacustris]
MEPSGEELRVLVGIDQDPNSHSLAQVRLLPMQRPGLTMHFMQGNYSQVGDLLRSLPLPSSAAPTGPDSPGGNSSGGSGSSGQAMPAGALWGRVDGMLLDLGVSSMQLDMAERGFSFMRDGPLDMRMDPASALTAEEVVNSWSEAELGRILRTYGEEKLWRQVAHRIVQARQEGPLRSTQQLAQAVGQTRVGGPRGSKGIHPATRAFQAIRIAVNDELGNLERAIPEAISCLASGGRLAVISFHSLEDRVVKKAFARAAGKTSSEDEHLAYRRHTLSYPDALEAGATAQLLTRSPLIP